MLKAIQLRFSARRRQRQLAHIRRKFADCGYPLDHLDDSKLEAALTRGGQRIEEVPLTAKMIFHTLQRLPQGNGRFAEKKMNKRRNSLDSSEAGKGATLWI